MSAEIDPAASDFVSVVIPTYNRAYCLPRAMRSVLSQTHRNLELIIADDASTDGTEALVRGWDDPRIVYVRQSRNRGASAARNLGLQHARGSLIAFQDSDDEWLLDKLERQVATLRSADPGIGATFGAKLLYGRDLNYVYGEGRVAITPLPGYRSATGELTPDLVRRNLISPQTLLVRSEAVLATGEFDTRLPCNNDWEWMLRLSTKTRIMYTPEPVVIAYVQKDSIHRSKRGSVLSYLVILRKHDALFSKYTDAMARHLFRAGRGLHRMGKYKSSAICMHHAIRASPRRPKFWLALFYCRLNAMLPR